MIRLAASLVVVLLALASAPARAHGGSLADGILFALLGVGLAVVVALALMAWTARSLLRARGGGLTLAGRRRLRTLGVVDVVLAGACVPLFFVTGGGGDSWKLVWPGFAFLAFGVLALRQGRVAKPAEEERDVAA